MRTPTPLSAVTTMLDGLRDHVLDAVLDAVDPGDDTYVFVEGPRWSTTGGERVRTGWRDYFAAPIRLEHWAWDEGPRCHQDGDLAVVAGILACRFRAAGRERDLRMRMTWVLGRRDGVWRIRHEHGSQPMPDPYGTGDWSTPDRAAGPPSVPDR